MGDLETLYDEASIPTDSTSYDSPVTFGELTGWQDLSSAVVPQLARAMRAVNRQLSIYQAEALSEPRPFVINILTDEFTAWLPVKLDISDSVQSLSEADPYAIGRLVVTRHEFAALEAELEREPQVIPELVEALRAHSD